MTDLLINDMSSLSNQAGGKTPYETQSVETTFSARNSYTRVSIATKE